MAVPPRRNRPPSSWFKGTWAKIIFPTKALTVPQGSDTNLGIIPPNCMVGFTNMFKKSWAFFLQKNSSFWSSWRDEPNWRLLCPTSWEDANRLYSEYYFTLSFTVPRWFNPIKLPLFCQEILGLCFYRLFHWGLDSVRFSFPDCF